MSDTCGCCADDHLQTPEPTTNRAGLPALAYRVGTHASFLATMRARLAAADLPALRGLRTRAADDPAIALLDTWACVADVLSFYNERIINESYLRTATERRSLVELARLIGYAPRPGVAASVFLAYTVEDTSTGDVRIPVDTRAQSIPGPGEQPQSFETADPLTARAAWNALKPRTSRPPYIILDTRGPISPYDARLIDVIFFKGISSNLRPGDMLLLVFDTGAGQQVPRKVQAIEALPAENRTKVTLQPLSMEYAFQQLLAYWDRIDPAPDRKKLTHIVDVLRVSDSQSKLRHYPLLNKLLKSLVVPQERMEQIISKLELGIKESEIFSNDPATPLQAEAFSLRGFLESFLSQLDPAIIDTALLVQMTNVVLQLLRHTSIIIPAGSAEGMLHAVLVSRGTDDPKFANTLREALADLVRAPDAPAPVPIEDLLRSLVQPPSRPPRSAQALALDTGRLFDGRSDALLGVLAAASPALTDTLAPALAAFAAASPPLLKAAYAMRVKAAPHGHNVPRASLVYNGGMSVAKKEWLINQIPSSLTLKKLGRANLELSSSDIDITGLTEAIDPQLLPLDASYDQLITGGWVVVERPKKNARGELRPTAPIIAQALKADTVARTAYDFPAKVTQLTLNAPWLGEFDESLGDIRSTAVYAQSEPLELADEPITNELADDEVELDSFYADLKPGRWLIVGGERADTPGTAGVRAAELVMLAAVRHDTQDAPEQSQLTTARDTSPAKLGGDTSPAKLGGDTRHTTLVFAKPLNYRYRRASVTIYGNVVRATHGETHPESLGGGDGSKPFQRFALRQGPLTYVAAPTAAGAASTLQVRVNDVLWHPVEQLSALGPNDRSYTVQTADDGTVSEIFGDGSHGARLPTGVENIRAVYRTGIGTPGNVRAEQISLLTARPSGVRAVINPLAASGGADRDGPDAIRTSAPLTVTALDRLVSVQDYTDFARIFAGIGKAYAVRLSDGAREVVHLTVAGADDIPLDLESDLMRNLKLAVQRAGDPAVPLRLAVRRLQMLLIKARVRVHPDYLWEKVEPQVRDALLNTFSFTRRDLGQPACAADALVAMQRVPGVVYVDLDAFGAVAAQDAHGLPVTPDKLSGAINKLIHQTEPQQAVLATLPTRRDLAPAEIIYLVPAVAKTTLLLEELQ